MIFHWPVCLELHGQCHLTLDKNEEIGHEEIKIPAQNYVNNRIKSEKELHEHMPL